MTMGEARDRKPELYGVGGWLAFLCISLLILTPLGLLVEIVRTLSSLGQSGSAPEAVFVIVVGIVITGFAIYTGLGLVRTWRSALRTAKLFFSFSAGLGALAALGFAVEPETTTPSEVVELVRWLGGSVAWLVYLYRSERVRNTYGKNPIRDAAEVFR